MPIRTERRSLRRRLLHWLLPPMLGLTVVWAGGVYAVVVHFTDVAYDRALEDSAESLAAQVRVTDGLADVDLPPAALQMLEFDQVDAVYFDVVDDQSRQLFGNRSLPAPVDVATPGGREARPTGTHFYDSRLDGRAVRIAQTRVVTDSASGVVSVRVAETIDKRRLLAGEVFRFVLVPQLLFVLGMAGLIGYGVGRGMAPVSQIRDAIARRTHMDLSPLPDSQLPAEIHEQVRVINDLMARLDRTLTTQRRFIADATHQLRTPITVLRAQAELALRLSEPAEMRAALRRIDAATARLARLANQLLQLSHAEAGVVDERDFVDVDLAELLDDVVAALVPAALAKGVDVVVDGAGAAEEGAHERTDPAADARVHGHRAFLGEMLSNLIDNAIRYTPPGGQVRVGWQRLGQQLFCRIDDDGPGIADEDVDKVFDRFFRSASASADGSGLGLSIAQEIAALHAGTITLARGDAGRGLQVTVTLPHRDRHAPPAV